MVLNEEKRMPAYPLFVKDPYFSIWSPADELNNENTVYWHGEEKPIYGYLIVDGIKYCFMGLDSKAIKLKQIGVELKALSTIYRFQGDDFFLTIEFLSPLLLNNLDVLACPVCFLNYKFESLSKHDVALEIIIDQKICYNTCYDEDRVEECRGNRFEFEDFECVSFGLNRQMPLSHSFDEVGADWGYYYLTGKKCEIINQDNYLFLKASDFGKEIRELNGRFMLAFDDIVSIFYYGEFLKGYYFRNDKTIFDALKESHDRFSSIKKQCDLVDERLIKYSEKYGEEYLFVLYAAYRQSIAGHKLVEDKNGRILFLSKECNSDGCIATVDVTYPSMPLFLLENPKLVQGMLNPIFDFSRKPIWKYDFAPHDAGIYPYCLGQYYAVKSDKEKQLDLEVWDWKKQVFLPFYYQFPEDMDIYDLNRQMPVEECGNMLIVSCLTAVYTKDYSNLKSNFDLLTKWAKYLVEYGLIPSNQLSTDDFSGHLDKNANLAIKAIMGIKAFGMIAGLLGKSDISNEYLKTAAEYAQKWMSLYYNGTHSLLALNVENSYSLKYNLALDALIGEPLFSKEFKEKELDYYLSKKNKFGIPLDNRNTYSKTDWLIWVSCLTEDLEKQKEVIKTVYKFLCHTPDRVPFSDWIDTETGKYNMFRNRTVQGGLFLPVLMDTRK